MRYIPLGMAVVLLLTPVVSPAGSYTGFALSVETGLSTYGLSDVPLAFGCGLDLGFRLREVAFTLGYFAEPFAEMGGCQGPRFLVYYYTLPASQLFLRLGGGVDYFWRTAPFNETTDGRLVERLWSGELLVRVGVKLFGTLDAFVDSALFFPVGRRVGLTVRMVFGLGYQL